MHSTNVSPYLNEALFRVFFRFSSPHKQHTKEGKMLHKKSIKHDYFAHFCVYDDENLLLDDQKKTRKKRKISQRIIFLV